VCGTHPHVQAAFQAQIERIPVTLKSVYEKLQHIETHTSAELVGVTGGKLRSGARELARSFPHRTEKDHIASSYSAETLGPRKGRYQGLSVWSG
jgi:hypothetical protein